MLLGGTVWLRPYVFIFLGAYLLLATWHLGGGRALAFLVLGYLIVLAGGARLHQLGLSFRRISLHPRHPGPGTLGGRGPFHGFPVLRLSGLCQLLPWPCWPWAGAAGRGWGFLLEEEPRISSWRVLILGAVLMVALDMVIDPVALRGYRWFLGQIYGYPEAGVYFGITLSQFWGLVPGGPGPHPRPAIPGHPPAAIPGGTGAAGLSLPGPAGARPLPGNSGIQPVHDLLDRGNLPGLGGSLYLPAFSDLAGAESLLRGRVKG